jgi:hypothetical protein
MEQDSLKMEKEKYDKAISNSNLMQTFNIGSSLMTAGINANILQGNFEELERSAEAVELQALERANILRERYSKSVGDFIVGAARRGIKISSGSVKANIERSAEELGEDIQNEKENAKAYAERLRTKANRMKSLIPICCKE